MDFQELITKRRSVRKFSDKKVDRETLQKIVEMAITAPSSRNSHSTHFIVVTNPEIIKGLSTMRDFGSSFVKDAPAVIVVMGDTTKTDKPTINSSISATMLHLAAVEMGLASCWVHVQNSPQIQSEPTGAKAIDKVRELLTIPEECDVLCLFAIGYSDFEPKPIPEFDRETLVSFVE
ncbi:MAG: nitroreductase family protein [Rikenellaceae bacterium]